MRMQMRIVTGLNWLYFSRWLYSAELFGCTDETACNYDATANTDEGCVYADANADQRGDCLTGDLL